ncbi:MAG TPA: glycosyltransferase [Gemmatales bacterium]|nr:glycosyltransferase [Gemmatales bacterium]
MSETQSVTVTPDALLRGRDMLCFSHDWNSDPLSKTHLMRLLSKDNRILWVNSIGYRAPTASSKDIKRAWNKIKAATEAVKEVIPNLFVLSPLAIPAWGKPWIQSLNRKLLVWQIKKAMRKLRFKKPINWVFNPAASVLAGQLGEEQVIYYCVDEYTAFSGVPAEALINMERQLLQRADLVIVSADQLLQSKKQYQQKTVLVRHGVDYDHFRQAVLPETPIAEELRNLPHPILGYFGLMSEDWVDVPLLVKVAEKYKNSSLVLLGKVTMDLGPLHSMPNVHILGRKPYSTLPGYCKGFDVALIPFPISEVTLNANPLKAREYLAAGLPVVSTAIPEVEVLGECGIGHSDEEFLQRIDEALKQPGPDQARSDRMKTESWSARLDDIRRHLAHIS